MIQDISFRTDPQTASNSVALKDTIARMLGISLDSLNEFRVVKRSIDARQKKISVNLTVRVAIGDDTKVHCTYQPKDFDKLPEDAKQVVIVGAGPAGLFAALKCIELGLRPLVLERGDDVDNRLRKLALISREGKIDPDTNYCFGEGGAGAYSDGKLFTRSKKRGNVSEILGLLHQHGASDDILIDSHPHIGSDRLPGIIRNIRYTIIKCGGEVKFNTRVTGLKVLDNNTVIGVQTSSGDEYMGPVILATGHSARDVYYFLEKDGVELESKGLAIGVRLEHPQELIDRLRYHSSKGRGKYLPAAEYSYVTQCDGRGVYSFCMCPGGVIVPSMSYPGESVVNGMSSSSRSSKWANSGMVVEIRPGDFEGISKGPMEMLELQEKLEQKFFEAAGQTLKAPAQRMRDFVEGKDSETLPKSSYAPGLIPYRLDKLLPNKISGRLKQGFKEFEKKNPGFLTNEAVLIGLESRTSSPIRIPRKADSLEHVTIRGLYPAGEGAGYAGGIVSAAIDGQKCAEAIAQKLLNCQTTSDTH